MNYPSREYIEHLCKKYPVGSRIQLNELKAPYSKLKSGEAGNLLFIALKGAIPYEVGKYDAAYANYTPGYLTFKAA